MVHIHYQEHFHTRSSHTFLFRSPFNPLHMIIGYDCFNPLPNRKAQSSELSQLTEQHYILQQLIFMMLCVGCRYMRMTPFLKSPNKLFLWVEHPG